MSDRFKTNYMDEIPDDGVRLYDITDKNGNKIESNVKLVRSNGNKQEGDVFSSEELNAINKFLNGLLNGKEIVKKAELLQGYDITIGSGKNATNPHGKIPVVGDDGVIEVGAIIDMHQKGSLQDFDLRLRIRADGIYQQLPDNTIRKIIVDGDTASNALKLSGWNIYLTSVVVNPAGTNKVIVNAPAGSGSVIHVFALNGDEGAVTIKVTGITYNSTSKKITMWLERTLSGNMRLNYVVLYGK